MFTAEKKRICYFVNWAQFRSGNAKYTYADIDPSLCSHIVFAYVGLDKHHKLEASEYNDEGTSITKGV